MDKKRYLYLFKDYFRVFYLEQDTQVKHKIAWTFELLESLDRIPELYLKHLTGTKGLYEIRVQSGNDAFRIFCFFNDNKLVIGHGFQKKTDKTPRKEIKRAEEIKNEYYEKNATHKS